MQIKKEIYN
jgi:hypothetical protein